MAEIKDILRQHLEKIKLRIAENMASHSRSASGRSVASLKVEVKDDRGTITALNSFEFMERGRGPGKVPYNFTKIIKDWIVAKGISPRSNAKLPKTASKNQVLNSFAGAVAFTIMKKGTKLHRDRKTDNVFSAALKDELDEMANDLALKIFQQIDIINKTEDKQ